MKEKIRFVFRWLNFKSVVKFTDINDVIAFILPTTGFYYDIVPKILDFPRTVLLITIVVIFMMLFLFNVYKRYTNHEKSIAEVLETGYFTNFLDKTALYFKNQRDSNSDIILNFKDKTYLKVKPNAINVQVLLPLSKSSLKEITTKIDAIAKPATIDNGPWVLAKHNTTDNTITIYECPRTLQTLSRYIDSGENDYNEEQSKRLHKFFNDKFDRDWDKAGDNIPQDIFTKNNRFIEISS